MADFIVDITTISIYNQVIQFILFIPLGVIQVKRPKGKYAWSVTVGTKGQIVLPKEAREIFDIQPGDTLIVLADVKRGIAIPPKSVFESLSEKIFNLKDREED